MSEKEHSTHDRAFIARAVRRRLADHRLAADLRTRGWTATPPSDDLEKHVRRVAVRHAGRDT